MKKVVLIVFFLNIFLTVNSATASYFFEITEISPMKLAPNSETNFTVSVKGLGSEGGYVDIVFRNLPANLSIIQNSETKYIFSGATNSFNGTISAGNVAPGNYTFGIGLSAKGSPYNWRTANIVVEPTAKKDELIRTLPTDNITTSRSKAKGAIGFDILSAMAAILITARRIRS